MGGPRTRRSSSSHLSFHRERRKSTSQQKGERMGIVRASPILGARERKGKREKRNLPVSRLRGGRGRKKRRREGRRHSLFHLGGEGGLAVGGCSLHICIVGRERGERGLSSLDSMWGEESAKNANQQVKCPVGGMRLREEGKGREKAVPSRNHRKKGDGRLKSGLWKSTLLKEGEERSGFCTDEQGEKKRKKLMVSHQYSS